MTRKWRDHKSLVQLVRLFLIDEVHQLNDETRGPTMEAIVSRMKTIRSSLQWEGNASRASELRFIAVSATMPNISDVSSTVYFKRAKQTNFCTALLIIAMHKILLHKILLNFQYIYLQMCTFGLKIVLFMLCFCSSYMNKLIFKCLFFKRLLPGLVAVRGYLHWSMLLMRGIDQSDCGRWSLAILMPAQNSSLISLSTTDCLVSFNVTLTKNHP